MWFCRGNGVEKIFKLEPELPRLKSNIVYYIIFSNMITFKKVMAQIRTALDPHDNVNKTVFHVIIVPTSLFLYESVLEELGLYSVVKLHSLQWLPLYLDEGIISLELPDMYNKLFIQQDFCLLSVYARSLWQLFFVLGKPNFIMALGSFANTVLKQLDIFCEDIASSDKFDSTFGGLVILDRSLDYPSAFFTPGTYAALLNEVYGVKCGVCEHKVVNDNVLNEKFMRVVHKQPVNFILGNKQDSVYKDIKNRYFTEVISVLSNLTKQLRNESVNSKDMALDEIKRYVQTQLQVTKFKKQSIANHLSAAESIINIAGPRFEKQHEIERNIVQNKGKSSNFSYLQDTITTENNILLSLRLFCLMSVTQKLTDSEINSFWNEFVNQFGMKYSYVYEHLMNANFIPKPSNATNLLPTKLMKIPMFERNNFYINANKLKQVPNDPSKIDFKCPTCCSYVYGGLYIPLVTQIASLLLNATPLDEVKTKLECFGNLQLRNEHGYPLQPRSVLMYVIGGVTYAEIAACNLLEVLTGAKVVLVSDAVISGNDLMRGMLKLPDE